MVGFVALDSLNQGMKNNKPTRSKLPVLNQICKLIPRGMLLELARNHAIQEKTRSFSPWSHVVALIYSQLAHCVGLNDVCDGLKNHAGKLSTIRLAKAPSKNGLSHANRNRDPKMAESLFWRMLKHLENIQPAFGRKGCNAMPRRFKRAIHAVDASTIELVANCMDWAQHRRRKAAAKLHLRLDLQSFLPKFAIVDTAAHSDSRRAREVCAAIKSGEISVFDKAYIDYDHLCDLDKRGVFWVTRAKENMSYIVMESATHSNPKIVSDERILLDQKNSNNCYPQQMRRVKAWVQMEKESRLMVFISNNFEWAASSICDLYKSRWKIEIFFKQIKQTLQLCDFLGHNANAVHWQVWISLLVYVLMRFLAHQSNWVHSFTRLFTLVRSILWDAYSLMDLLDRYGTAGGHFRLLSNPQEAFLPGFEEKAQ